MIKPGPMKFTCKSCNWQKTTHPKSAALGPGDYFSACLKCDSEELDVRAGGRYLGVLEILDKLFSGKH